MQYMPSLAARGWSVEWQPLLPDHYLQRLYLHGRRSFLEVCRAYGERLRYLRRAISAASMQSTYSMRFSVRPVLA